MIEILEHVKRVHSQLAESSSPAFSIMSGGILPFFTDDALAEMAEDPEISELLSLAGYEIQIEGRAKDVAQVSASRAQTATLYHGIPDEITKHGHEANVTGLRAVKMGASMTASPQQKMGAHEEASAAHAHAAQKFAKHGHAEAAAVHQRAVSYHNAQRNSLAKQHVGAEMGEDAVQDLRPVPLQMNVAISRMEKLKKTNKAKSEPKIPKVKPAPTAEDVNFWFAVLDEADDKYHPDVKNASIMAAKATAETKKPNSSPQHHDTAARMHFIAAGVAQAHGHVDLQKKHLELQAHHVNAAKQGKTAAATG